VIEIVAGTQEAQIHRRAHMTLCTHKYSHVRFVSPYLLVLSLYSALRSLSTHQLLGSQVG